MEKTKEKVVKKAASKDSTKKTNAKKVETKKVTTNSKTTKKPAVKKDTKTVAKKSTAKTKKVATKATSVKTVAKKAVAKKTEVKVDNKVEKQVVKTGKATDKTKVLFVVSECLPFCATGGLADVAGGLPKYVAKNSNTDIRVMLPMYSDIPQEYRKEFKFVGNINVPLSWRSIYCGVFSYKLEGVTYYFLDNEYYFKRGGGIYSYYDDGERFAFSSRAVLEVLPLIDFIPNLIHSNDWQFALVPIYLKTIYNNNDLYKNIKTVFTCHNTEYQGKFDVKSLTDLFGIDAKYKTMLEYNGNINLVKGAVVCCDKFSTVSPSYAKEILTPEHSNGLESILRSNEYKTIGILNGIDYSLYDPMKDKILYKNFDASTYKLKKENKLAIQKEYGLNVDENAPMISMVTRMTRHKGLDLVKASFEDLLNKNNTLQLVVVGNGDAEYENYFKYLKGKFPNRVNAKICYSNTEARKVYAASDIFVMPSKSEPCGISQMVASRYGSVPIVRETGGLKDSIKDFGCEGGGNGYTFANYNVGDFVYSINRALNDYKNSASWQKKSEDCMNTDFSWNVSAKEYVKLYNEVLGK